MTVVEFLLSRLIETEAEALHALTQAAIANETETETARTLVDVAVKRRILENLGPPHFITGGSSAAFQLVARLLAEPYASHTPTTTRHGA